MKERKLILEPQFEGIYVREEGDEKYGAYITNDRRLRIFKRFKTWRIQAT